MHHSLSENKFIKMAEITISDDILAGIKDQVVLITGKHSILFLFCNARSRSQADPLELVERPRNYA